MIGFVIILILVGVIVFYFVSTYNRFQELKNGADATLGQVKVALKKRLDMLSQLIDSIKSYANFEKSTLENIVKLRNSIVQIDNPKDISNIEKQSKALMGSIMITVENYPDLKTSQVVKDLTSSIQSLEDEISRHRYTYNNIVQEYNTMIDTIPSNFVASFAKFTKKEYLEFEEDIQKTPSLKWEV